MNHLCIGCGVCAAACPSGRITMAFSERLGFFQPSDSLMTCDNACGICEKVCPFVPENPPTADLTRELFASTEDIRHDDVLGYYLSTYVGYSIEHRMTSASGGVATWLLETLLTSGEVDRVLCVGPDEHSPILFTFRVCGSVEEIRACSGSHYQAAEISRILHYVLENNGRYAVITLPCVAKALRLAMDANSRLKSRMRYVLGLTCGQTKSRHFIDYIAMHFAGRENPIEVQFRSKQLHRAGSAFDFFVSFAYCDAGGESERRDVRWNEGIDRIWCGRWFSLEACDYCDDVFAECADAVFMDAWLPEYSRDPQGMSLVVTRDKRIDTVLMRGMSAGEVECKGIPPARVLESQRGVIYQKRVLAGCHYKASRGGMRIALPRHGVLTGADRKVAFVKRNVRRCLQEGPSTVALKMVAWLASSWGWRFAKLYSLMPWTGKSRSNNAR